MTLHNPNCSITISGTRTTIRLEPEMWKALHDIAAREGCTVHKLATLINRRKRPGTTISSSIRVFTMLYYRAAATEQGHALAGHGDFNRMVQRAGRNDKTKENRETACRN